MSFQILTGVRGKSVNECGGGSRGMVKDDWDGRMCRVLSKVTKGLRDGGRG